ncbi:hypothetical protein ACEZNI_003841 [Vibrio parahaemolyticus]
MKFTVLTQGGIHSLDSNFINHMYPSSKMYNYCAQQLEGDISQQHFKNTKHNSYAGPLSKLPNNNNGEKRKQALLKKMDNISNYKANKVTDRLHWSGKQVPPTPKFSSLAPITHGSNLTKRTTGVSGTAMAVGIILQVGRSKILFKTMKKYLISFVEQTAKKYPNSKKSVFAVTIIYLKVEREYGRAPIFSGVHLLQVLDTTSNFNPLGFVGKMVSEVCQPRYRPKGDKLESINLGQLDNPDLYETATLFVMCEW